MKFNDLLSFLQASKNSQITVHRGGLACRAKLACSLLQKGRSVALVARNPAERLELKALLQLFTPQLSAGDVAPGLASWDEPFLHFPPVQPGVQNKAENAQRMAALFGLQNKSGPVGILSCLDNFLLKTPPKNWLPNHNLLVQNGQDIAQDFLLEQAIAWGYVRQPMLSQPGEISVRGDILDIFVPGYNHPVRIEFFGDSIEQIRLFDVSSQRSIAACDELMIIPAAPIVFAPSEVDEAKKYWQQLEKAGSVASALVDKLWRGVERDGLLASLQPGLFYEQSSNLMAQLPQDTIFLLPPAEELGGLFEEELARWKKIMEGSQDAEQAGEASEKSWQPVKSGLPGATLAQPLKLILTSQDDILKRIKASSRVFFEELPFGPSALAGDEENFALNSPSGPQSTWHAGPHASPYASLNAASPHANLKAASPDASPAAILDFPERSIRSFSELFPLPGDRERPWNRFVEQLKAWKGEAKTVLLSFPTARSRAKFLNLIEQDGINPVLNYNPATPGIYALVSPFRQGAELPWAGLIILGEDVIQPRKQGSERVKSRAFAGLDKYDDLKPGDHLVHRDFGVGRFEGLHSLKLGDVEADFLLLIYSDDDKFYLPVDRLSLIQRFKGPDGLVPPLDKLGGSSWQASKSKVKKAIEQIAQDLVEMYAYRKLAKGYGYGQVNELFSEFEASFGFEETPDQARAIDEVLEDMDRPEAMDRLVCGDVGFGKTEVALRAAFRAAAAGKQVALLCPTTVLAEQHYKTFTSRLSGFGLNVGLLSRFVSRKDQLTVLENSAKGLIDVLIGTHRLLSGDVKMPNLSLLILDEEQRFGVRHKEKLKQLKQNIDVLTLTATPIPRTLQLSIAGLRGLSVIETAPPERKPVASMVIQRDDAVLKGVLERELARQGQIFWVYNRVQDIERVVEYVRKLAPEARVAIAHGQMPERQLEDAMHKFWHGEIDILVCTAIIESGLDFPRANTLVVDQAQHFGLGQLYQLRGRVGRSDLQAYAVFVAPGETKSAPKQLGAFRERLRVILDMDYLGAGFQVAMEDLRIRGAGNILGEAQSGHMARVGLDLYLEMLEEAVGRLKGDSRLEIKETELSIGIPALIPANYIQDSTQRLKYYKALSSAPDAKTQEDVELELRDLFGPLPDELINFIAVLVLKRLLTKLQVAKADIYESKLKLSWIGASEAIDPVLFVTWVGQQQGRAKVLPQNAIEYKLNTSLPIAQRLLAACNDLQGLLAADKD